MNQFKLSLLLLLFGLTISAQDAIVRGFVYDSSNGEPIIFTNVFLEGTTYGATTDIDGFYSINKLPAGDYTLICKFLSYEKSKTAVSVSENNVVNISIYLKEKAVDLDVITISAEKEARQNQVKTSTIKISPKQMRKLPSVGGEPDLAQYLQILPGVTFTGDQGGQLYIRGGAPIQTKVLMDGLTIYNPFHSIGFFSVFETDIIRNVEVMTGGFDASYGGRISAIIDITTKDGNKKEFHGKVAANPFLGKVVLEGPLSKLSDDGGGSSSFITSFKSSYLDKTSESLYSFIDGGLPYTFNDFYGKLSFNSETGSKAGFFGYIHNDRVAFPESASYAWDAYGVGTDFVVVPLHSKMVLDGKFSYSNYEVELQEVNQKPSTSLINGFNMGLNFGYYLGNGHIKYGFDIAGFKTNFEYWTPTNLKLSEKQNTTEIAGYFANKAKLGNWVIEPGIRFTYYASLATAQLEPRLGVKYNVSRDLRLKGSFGKYTQNFLSTKSDQDIVNLFTGFLSAPESSLNDLDGNRADNNLQIAYHYVAGVEYDLTRNISINVEGYYKDFSQIVNINRNKLFPADPNFIIESGEAYGFDFLTKYEMNELYLWAVYSYGVINRFDGVQEYNPHYDRRHNMNLVANYAFGPHDDWEIGARWNFGSGFPFTKTQGFFEELDFEDGLGTDILTQNGDLGVIYDDEINGGRLPDYHRLDMSIKKTIVFSEDVKAEINASVTNVYDRSNIFYFDRIRYDRVDQLPMLPSLGFSLSF